MRTTLEPSSPLHASQIIIYVNSNLHKLHLSLLVFSYLFFFLVSLILNTLSTKPLSY